jgi:hypothetical protein
MGNKPLPGSMEGLQEDFCGNTLANAKLLLRISRALEYEELETPDGMIAALLKLAAETLERGKGNGSGSVEAL